MNNEENNLNFTSDPVLDTNRGSNNWTSIRCVKCGDANYTNMSIDLTQKQNWIRSCYYRNSYNNCEHQFKEY